MSHACVRDYERRHKSSADFLPGTIQVAIMAAAAGLGIWTGSSASPLHFASPLQWVKGFRHPVSECARGAADAPSAVEGSPIGAVEINRKRLAVVIVETGAAGGVADVFDRDGRLIQRYAAVKRADSSWELLKYVTLPADVEPRLKPQPGSVKPTTQSGH